MLRLIRELLAFQPQGTGTDIKMALDKVNRILQAAQRSSSWYPTSSPTPESYRVAMATTNRRHDLIAVDLHDPLESEIGNVGLLAIEDPETGEIRWVDTGSKAWRTAFRQRVEARPGRQGQGVSPRAAVDHIGIGTDQDYVAPLTAFFQERYKRLRHWSRIIRPSFRLGESGVCEMWIRTFAGMTNYYGLRRNNR